MCKYLSLFTQVAALQNQLESAGEEATHLRDAIENTEAMLHSSENNESFLYMELQVMKEKAAIERSCTQEELRENYADQISCVVCQGETATVIVDPCGHVPYCQHCARTETFSSCSFCRGDISRLISIVPRVSDLNDIVTS